MRETVADGFLQDHEDCDYTQEQLAGEIGNARVAQRVAWVSVTKQDAKGEKISWEERSRHYRERLARKARRRRRWRFRARIRRPT